MTRAGRGALGRRNARAWLSVGAIAGLLCSAVSASSRGVVDPYAEPLCGGATPTQSVAVGAQELRGTPRADVILGGPGADVIVGGGGRDVICAGGGDDVVRGGGGDDDLRGGSEDDSLTGGAGDDDLNGRQGQDQCRGGAGNDRRRQCEGSRVRDDAQPQAVADAFIAEEDSDATTLDVLANDTDIDGGPKTITAKAGGAHGTVAITHSGAELTYLSEPDFCGQDSFTYTLNGGATANVSVTVGCVDDLPAAVDDSTTVDEDSAETTLDVLANDTDSDGGPKTITAKAGGAHGTVAITNSGAELTYLPEPDFCGQDSFTYTLHGGATANVSVTVGCVDDLPVAVDDSKTIDEDDPATPIGVLANDADIDAGPKEIASTTAANDGTVQITNAGTDVAYTPDPGYCGSDSFTYTLNGDSTAMVTVTVACVDVQVQATPELYPEFDPAITDYVVRCDGVDPVSVDIDVTGATVSVDGGPANTGAFTNPVPIAPEQAFSLTTTTANSQTARTYHVRCLPLDFPQWSFTRTERPASDWYLLTPGLFGSSGSGSNRYVVFFDDYGVPIWWYQHSTRALDAKVLADGSVAWASFGAGYIVRTLDGTLVRTVDTVGVPTDHHDLQELPNGNFLVLAYKPREHVDLSAYGGPSDATVTDAEIQEVDPQGNLVWSWNSKDHIDLAETGRWWPQVIQSANQTSSFYDIVHINSVEVDGNSIVASMRHTDAVYKIDRTSGEIVWKLGGTTTPESLSVTDDPLAANPLGGQHDARILDDETLTVHDNGSGLNRPPRSIRYRIDELAGTAQLLEAVADPDVASSPCCGGTRRADNGSWVTSWGGVPVVSEFAADGDRAFKFSFDPAGVSYRVVPVNTDLVTGDQLRDGMDSMHPR